VSWRYIVLPLVAWAVAQGTKVVRDSVRRRRVYLRGLTEMGGMPSSHSAMVMALTATIGRFNGVTSPVFALALIFSFVVMYDAAGVRDIVRRTGLAAGTFYNYFPDKEAVFRALVDEFALELRARVREARARATGPEEFVREGYRAFFGYVAQEPVTFELIRRNAGVIPAITEDPVLGVGVTELARDLDVVGEADTVDAASALGQKSMSPVSRTRSRG